MLPAYTWLFFHYLRNFSDVSPSHKKTDSVPSDHLSLSPVFSQTGTTENQIQKHNGRNISGILRMAYYHAILPSNVHLLGLDHLDHQRSRLMTGLQASKTYPDHTL